MTSAVIRLRRPMLTVTFDGFSRTAATLGTAALERVEARGTFYAGPTLDAGVDRFDGAALTRLIDAGHEIGCMLGGEAPRDACARTAIELALMGLRQPPRTAAFARPDADSAHTAAALGFECARASAARLNVGRANLMALGSFPFESWAGAEPLLATLKEAERRGAWMIVRMRDVAQGDGAPGAPLGALGALLLKARALKFDILPMSAAADRVRAAPRARAA